MSITLQNINQFSKVFHCCTQGNAATSLRYGMTCKNDHFVANLVLSLAVTRF